MYKNIFKKVFIILILFAIICPIKSFALSFEKINSNSFIYLLDDEDATTSGFLDEDLLDQYNQDQTCDGDDDSILGNVNDEESVAWLLQKILNFIKIVGPLGVILLSSVDFIGVIVKGDDEGMKKAQKKLTTRLILIACLFFIPTVTAAILDIFGITSSSICGLS